MIRVTHDGRVRHFNWVESALNWVEENVGDGEKFHLYAFSPVDLSRIDRDFVKGSKFWTELMRRWREHGGEEEQEE